MATINLGTSNGSDDNAQIESAMVSAGVGGKIIGIPTETYFTPGLHYNVAGLTVETVKHKDIGNRAEGSATVYIDSPDILFYKSEVDGSDLNTLGIRVDELAERFRMAKGVVENVRYDSTGPGDTVNVSGILINGGEGHIIQDTIIRNLTCNGLFGEASCRGIRLLYNSQLPDFKGANIDGCTFENITTPAPANDAEAICWQGGNLSAFDYAANPGILVRGCTGTDMGKRFAKFQGGGMKVKSCTVTVPPGSTFPSGLLAMQAGLDSEAANCFFTVQHDFDKVLVMFGSFNGSVLADNQLMRNMLIHLDAGIALTWPIYAEFAGADNSGFRDIVLTTAAGTSIQQVARIRPGWPNDMVGQIWSNIDYSGTTNSGEFFNG